jgi:hypothetical protein
MPPIPPDQCPPSYDKPDGGRVSASRKHGSAPASTVQQRQGDRTSGDDDDDDDDDDDGDVRRALPVYVRYVDLVEANIVRSWTQLLRLIDVEGFPVGQMLSPNIRAWRADEVRTWLAGRPTARKIPPPATRPRGRKERADEREDAQTEAAT